MPGAQAGTETRSGSIGRWMNTPANRSQPSSPAKIQRHIPPYLCRPNWMIPRLAFRLQASDTLRALPRRSLIAWGCCLLPQRQ